MSFRLGLTGSIGMGKSTTAAMFSERGFPVWDADQAVHRLYSPGGAAVGPVSAAFPGALKDGAIDRDALKSALGDDRAALSRLEAIVHPLVARDRADFLDRHQDSALIVFDIPLMFEGGSDKSMDGVAVVSTDAETQRARVLARPGMTNAHFQTILAKQLPDAEKRARATHVIETRTLEQTRREVLELIEKLTKG